MRIKIILLTILLVTFQFGLVSPSKTLNIEVKTQTIFSNVNVSQEVPVQITITNNENFSVSLKVHIELPNNILVTGSYMVDSMGSTIVSSLTLKPQESRTILLTIIPSEPGKYSIPVIVTTEYGEKTTYITLNVMGEKSHKVINNKDENNVKNVKTKVSKQQNIKVEPPDETYEIVNKMMGVISTSMYVVSIGVILITMIKILYGK